MWSPGCSTQPWKISLLLFWLCCSYYYRSQTMLSVMCKDMSNASPRLQGLLLWIHRYDVVMHYQPGKEMHLADYLSGANHKLNWDTEIPGLELTVKQIWLVFSRFEMKLGMMRLWKSWFNSHWQNGPQLEVTSLKTSIPSGTIEMNFQL